MSWNIREEDSYHMYIGIRWRCSLATNMRTFEMFQELWTYIGDKPDEVHVLTFEGDAESRNRVVNSYLATTRTRGENNLQVLPADTPIYHGSILLHSHLIPVIFSASRSIPVIRMA